MFTALHHICKLIEVAIVHFDDIATFNCALCNLIVHLTFQMRKVLVTRNLNQTTRYSLPGSMEGWALGVPVLEVIFHHLHKTDLPSIVQLSHTSLTDQILVSTVNYSSFDTVYQPHSQAPPKTFSLGRSLGGT